MPFPQIAGGATDAPPALRDRITAHPTPQMLVGAVTMLLLNASSRMRRSTSLPSRCTMMMSAFAGWSSKEATTLLTALPEDARTAITPDPDIPAQRLARPKRQDSFRQALDALTALPLSVAIPALHVPGELTRALLPSDQRQASACLAQALRAHDDCFLAIIDALADPPRTTILPLPRSAIHAAALRTFAAADPLAVHHLASALRSRTPTAALDALMDAPFDALARIWQLLPEDFQQAMLGDKDALLRDVTAPGRAGALVQILQ